MASDWTLGGAATRFSNTYTGGVLKRSTAESLGWSYSSLRGMKGKSEGFLGWKKGLSDYRAAKATSTGTGLRTGVGRGLKSFGRAAFGGAVGIAFTAYEVSAGYKEEGVWGAAKGAGWGIAGQAVPRYLLGASGVAATAVIGAAAIGTYALGEAAISHAKKLRHLEMGGGNNLDVINSVGAATSRQRSLAALQNTHLNGRMAIGNEASLMHTSY
jgi:hypothetical protein